MSNDCTIVLRAIRETSFSDVSGNWCWWTYSKYTFPEKFWSSTLKIVLSFKHKLIFSHESGIQLILGYQSNSDLLLPQRWTTSRQIGRGQQAGIAEEDNSDCRHGNSKPEIALLQSCSYKCCGQAFLLSVSICLFMCKCKSNPVFPWCLFYQESLKRTMLCEKIWKWMIHESPTLLYIFISLLLDPDSRWWLSPTIIFFLKISFAVLYLKTRCYRLDEIMRWQITWWPKCSSVALITYLLGFRIWCSCLVVAQLWWCPTCCYIVDYTYIS